MATISVSLPSDGTTADVADYNTPITTIVNEINGALDNANIAAAAGIAGSKLASATVTPVQWTNPYCFYAYDSGGTTLTDNVATKINLATEVYDYNNNFASSTYTAPVAGVYHFDSYIESSGLATPVTCQSYIYKNGAVALRGPLFEPVSNGVGNTVSGDILLAASDTVELYHQQNTAGNETTTTGATTTYFSGHLVHTV